MYKVLTILPLLLAIFTLPALAQDTEEASGPAMTFEATTIDYGVIEQGSDRVRIFKFENTGTEPLIITKAKGSCGCTVPTYPKEPVLPGETGEIKVEYDTNRVGPFTKTVTLSTNAADRTLLTIKGEVKPKTSDTSGLPNKASNGFK